MNLNKKKELIVHFSQFISEHKNELFDRVSQSRTKYLTVVLENIYQPQNASAVLRTCDCFGVQDIHIIENEYEYRINPDVVMGATKWLCLHRYNQHENNTLSALKTLQLQGYRIVATTLHQKAVNLEDFDLTQGKVALFFGTELTGLSDTVLNNADEFLKIPMVGFTESFNISVSAAIILHTLSHKLRNSNINWHLTDSELTDLLLTWYRIHIKRSDLIEDRFLNS